MSDYIIHNIALDVQTLIDFNQHSEEDKPASEFPLYYLGKIIGKTGNELSLTRTRRGGGEEHVPNCVLRNENGIALIRIHNKENITYYNLPVHNETETNDCIGIPLSNYPFGYVVVDYRDGKSQLAIEKTSAWDSKTTTIRNSLEDFFFENGIKITIKEKSIRTKFEEFIDQRLIDHGDVIESFTFQYINLKRNPNARIPEELTEQMNTFSKILELFGAISGETTMKMGEKVDKDKLKQLSTVVGMCIDNAFNLIVKFRDYGDYTCNEDIVAKYPMNDIVISNYKDNATSDNKSSDFDLTMWLDEVFNKVKETKNREEIPTKPTRNNKN